MSARPSPSVSPARPRSPIPVRSNGPTSRRTSRARGRGAGGRAEEARAAEQHHHRAGAVTAREVGGADADAEVVHAVAVHVAETGQAEAQQPADAGNEADRARSGRGEVDGGDGGTAPDHVDGPVVRAAVARGERGADRDVVEPVAVQVARPRHGAQVLVRPPEDPHRPPRGRGREIDVGGRRRSEHDERRAHGSPPTRPRSGRRTRLRSRLRRRRSRRSTKALPSRTIRTARAPGAARSRSEKPAPPKTT